MPRSRRPVTGEPDTWRLQLAVSSEVMTPEERPAMNLTLVLDTSGSMAGEPIEMLKKSCRAIAAHLREGDTVSVVEWDTQNTWSLAGYAVTGPNDQTLLGIINAAEPGGGTDLNGGLDPWTFESKQITQTWTFAELAAANPSLLLEGEAIFTYAEGLAEYRQAIGNAAKAAALAPALDAVAEAQAALPGNSDLAAIAQILAKLVP
ncbi:MAG: VWA domain-containing protein [Enhygromyxa sp.]